MKKPTRNYNINWRNQYQNMIDSLKNSPVTIIKPPDKPASK